MKYKFFLGVVFLLLYGCEISINESNTESFGDYDIEVKPFSHTSASYSSVTDGYEIHTFISGDTEVKILNGRLFVNSLGYGKIPPISKVLVENSNVYVNGEARVGEEADPFPLTSMFMELLKSGESDIVREAILSFINSQIFTAVAFDENDREAYMWVTSDAGEKAIYLAENKSLLVSLGMYGDLLGRIDAEIERAYVKKIIMSVTDDMSLYFIIDEKTKYVFDPKRIKIMKEAILNGA